MKDHACPQQHSNNSGFTKMLLYCHTTHTYVDKLETLNLCYGVNGHPGVSWRHSGKIFDFNKTFPQIVSATCVTHYMHKLKTSYLWSQATTWSPQDHLHTLKPAGFVLFHMAVVVLAVPE